MRFIVLGLLAACGAQLPSSTAQVLGPTPAFTTLSATPGAFAGTWSSDGGMLTLDERGQQVSGKITGGRLAGTVQAIIEDGKLVGGYTMTAGTTGRFVATLDGTRMMFAIDSGPAIVFTRGGLAGCFQHESKDRFRYEVTRDTLKLDGAGHVTRDRIVTRTWGDTGSAQVEHGVGAYTLDGTTLRVTWGDGTTTTLELATYQRC